MGFTRDYLVPPGTPLMRDPQNRTLKDLEDIDCIALVGVPWDWGVTGRPGARYAPQRVRSHLYELKTHSPTRGIMEKRPRDIGDVKVAPGDWATTGARVEAVLREAYTSCRHVIVLGGDHSITEWTISPLVEEGGKVGILLLDAHFDMRSVEEGYTSGMWLYDLYRRYRGRVKASIIGVGEYANPPYLAARAREAGFTVTPAVDVLRDPRVIDEAVKALEGTADAYYISIDVDHIDQAFAPGVNSPSPLGLHPHHTLMILERAIPALCPKGVDVVEVVPDLDVADATVRLAALITMRVAHLLEEACSRHA